ncbi:MAG TPA: PEP-CTERM sorting domain-containing protein [Bryobacteraceae bacterium]|nr:PEP-CTERM sorting domain-containing protein [Bryobacteraceae bacterium]
MLKRLLITVAVVSLFVPAVALAEEIGIFTDTSNDYDLNVSGGHDVFSINANGYFTFGPLISTVFGQAPVQATIDMSASTSSDAYTNGGTQAEEDNFSGSFTIYEFGTLHILLAGTFGTTGASLSGSGGSGNFQDSTPPTSEVVYTSDYLDFTPSTNYQAFSFSLSSFTPGLSYTGSPNTVFLDNATAAGSGTFSADPGPTPDTPEPASMFLSGGALLGLGLLLRKRKA